MRPVFLCLFGIFLHHAQAEVTFNQFQLLHNRTYKSDSEKALRERIFQSNVQTIVEHNLKFEQGLVSYEQGVNQFTDMTAEEIAATLGTLPVDEAFLKRFQVDSRVADDDGDVPESIDWRTKQVVTEIKNQGSCGSCWAFSAAASLEGLWAQQTNGTLDSLSAQQLLDCDTGSNGCDGGHIDTALNYAIDNGIASATAYSYLGYKGVCKTKPKVMQPKSMQFVRTEDDLKTAVGLYRPVAILVNADKITSYKSGIFDGDCTDELNHGVLLVGYGTDTSTGHDYWIIKNSWGASWGENGYYRMVRGVKKCGLNYGFYPSNEEPEPVTPGAAGRAGIVSVFLLVISTVLCFRL